jgi:gas vesicle protein
MLGSRFLLGVAIGGAAVYFFDPQNGVRRRAQLRAWLDESRVSETSAMVGEKVNEKVNETVTELQSRIRRDDRSEMPQPAPVK